MNIPSLIVSLKIAKLTAQSDDAAKPRTESRQSSNPIHQEQIGRFDTEKKRLFHTVDY
jgi:hypothetical protein